MKQDNNKKARWSRDQKLAAKRGEKKAPGAREARRAEQFAGRDSRGEARPYGDRSKSSYGDRGGFRSDRRDDRRDDRGGYQRRDERGFDRRPQGERTERGGERRYGFDAGESRGFDRGEGRREDRGGYQRRDDRGGIQRRDDRRDDRGGYQRRDDRSGYQRRDDRGFDRRPQGERSESRGWDRGDRDNRGERRGERFERRDDRGGYQRRDDRRDDRGGYQRRDRFEDRGSRGGRFEGRDRDFNRRDAREEHVNADLDESTYVEHTPATHTHAEPTTPLDLATNGFAALGVPEPMVERLHRDGITEPFPIQSATIPDALAGRDVLGRGRTGSGKTLAFGLPMLTRLSAGEGATRNHPRAIVLVPTRELAMQVSDALQPLVHVMGLHHKLVAGGMPYEPQLKALERGVDVLIATPGRLKDLMDRGAADLSKVELIVLDEADHMAEMGFLEAISEILDQVPGDGQRLLFSATLDRGVDGVVEKYLTDPIEHATDDGFASVSTMEHHALLIEPRDKKVVTAEVANRPGRTVVFVRTKLGADRVAGELRDLGVIAASLHGGLTQSMRNKVLGAFRDGRVPVLVATDVAARGIHVDDVGVVLQVDPPADHKDYLHRAGRTARAGEKGTVVSLALPHQRRMMQRLLDQAGVETTLQPARPGDEVIQAAGESTLQPPRPGDEVIQAAGGSTPQSEPISDDALYAILTPQREGRGGRNGRGGRGYNQGPRRGGRDFGGREGRREFGGRDGRREDRRGGYESRGRGRDRDFDPSRAGRSRSWER